MRYCKNFSTCFLTAKKIPPLAKGLISIAILKTIGIWIFLSFSPAKKVKVTPDTMHQHLSHHTPSLINTPLKNTASHPQKDKPS